MSLKPANITALFLIIIPILIGVYYFNTDISHEGSVIPTCMFKKWTGWSCMACGGQRALSSLLHGEWKEAFKYNAFLTLGTPLFLMLYVKTILELWGKKVPFFESINANKSAYIILITSVIFMIVRNLPGVAAVLSV